jgi:hypothetical protein
MLVDTGCSAADPTPPRISSTRSSGTVPATPTRLSDTAPQADPGGRDAPQVYPVGQHTCRFAVGDRSCREFYAPSTACGHDDNPWTVSENQTSDVSAKL